MKRSTTHIRTSLASSYIGKLCRHFRHKIETEYTETTGRAVFPQGICSMTAQPETLVFEIEATNTEALEQIKGVLIRHLLKFSYKETLEIEWQDDY